MTGWNQHPVVVSTLEEKTMFDSNRSDLEGIADIKDGIEEMILLHCWSQTSACPACGCDSALRIGPETGSEQAVEVVDCELCETVVQAIVGEIDADLV